ncbi:MAG: hypothetical protein ACLFV7_13055 [Phycisphaerae bacterium]
MKHAIVLLMVGAVLAPMACDDPTVEKDQTKGEFLSDVRDQLGQFENRLGELRAEIESQYADARPRMESAARLAEERIEQIRQEHIPALQEAGDPATIQQAKTRINKALQSVDERLDAVAGMIADSEGPREDYSEATNRRINELEERVAELRQKTEELSGEAKEKAEQSLKEAEEALADARENLPRYKDSADDDAESLKRDIDSAMERAWGHIKDAAAATGEAAEDAAEKTGDVIEDATD